jgi:hypothetical protein
MTEILVRRCKQLLYDLEEMSGYWECTEEVIDRPVWRTHTG